MYKIFNFSQKNILPTFKKFNNNLNLSLPQRLRGGFIENSLNYIRNVYIDYKTVYFETLEDIRCRPLRASIIGSILLSGAYCIHYNPNDEDFQMQLIDSNNRISRVPESIRNKESCDHIHELFQMNNKNLLRHQSLGLFSIIYIADYSPENDLFQAQCKYLRPSWKISLKNIVDIGFLNNFWYMHYKMLDYDINENEWKI